MKKVAVLVVFISILVAGKTFAQAGKCGQFHKKYCVLEGTKDDDREFIYNAQSKSGLFAQGSISKLRCVVYKGMDYRMSVCCETAGSNVNFKILDAKTMEEIYDNAKDENSQQFEFQSMATRQLIIEVSIPAGESAAVKGKPTDAACVGLLIEHKVADKVGFSTY